MYIFQYFNMRTCKIKSLIILILIIPITSFHQNKPKILIIGDSISIGYTPYVRDKLENEAIVFHNPGNAQHTGTGLEKIAEWIGDEQWDIVQFNWGLWDLCYRHPDSKVQGNRDKINGQITFSLEEYVVNLDSIVSKLKAISDAKLIFVTTSYVPKEEAGRYSKDAIRYNAAAKKVMKKHSIVVNDIYRQTIPIHKQYGKGPDDVHYTNQGYKNLSEQIANFLRDELNNKR